MFRFGDNAPQKTEDNTQWLQTFSRMIFLSSFMLIAILIVCVLGFAVLDAYFPRGAESDKRVLLFEAAKDVFSLVLPIISGWIGIVLGFYFSDRAAEARGLQVMQAQGDMRTMLSDRLKQVPVTEIMVSMRRIKPVILKGGDRTGASNLFKELKDVVDEPRYSRSPMFIQTENGQHVFVEIAHESAIYKFDSLTRVAMAEGRLSKALEDLTIKDFIESPVFTRHTTAFVPRSDTLEGAKKAMQALPGCQDVIITETGKPGDPVVGWLTNVDILRGYIARAEG